MNSDNHHANMAMLNIATPLAVWFTFIAFRREWRAMRERHRRQIEEFEQRWGPGSWKGGKP